MIFIIGGRGTGKTSMLLQMAQKDPTSLVVYPNSGMMRVHREQHKHAVVADYLLECASKHQELDWSAKVTDYTMYFEEPSIYWNTFLQILALVPPTKLKAAAYTPNNLSQNKLTQINPCLVDRVLRMSWEELPTCQKC